MHCFTKARRWVLRVQVAASIEMEKDQSPWNRCWNHPFRAGFHNHPLYFHVSWDLFQAIEDLIYIYIRIYIYIYIYVTFGYYFRELLHVSWSYSGHHLQMMFGVYKYTVTINWLFGETFFWWQLMTNNDKSYLKRERVLATRVASGTVSDRSMLLGNLCELCETWKIFRTDPTWKGFNEVWRGKNITKENLQFPPPGYKLIYNPI